MWAFHLSPILAALACAQTYRPCPLLGPRFPVPTDVASSETVQNALANLTKDLDLISTISNGSDFTATTPNTTTFSLALFAIDNNSTNPFFYEYHHAALNQANGTSGIPNAQTQYNVARVTTVFTVFSFLVKVGEKHYFDAVSKWVPGLGNQKQLVGQRSVDWNQVTLLDLASNMAGISANALLDTVSASDLPRTLSSFIKTVSSDTSSRKTRQSFLQTLQQKPAIFLPATTPVYSEAGFQLLAMAMEGVTGRSYQELLNEIFRDLNMTASSLGNMRDPVQESAILAGNFMNSTITDLSRAGTAMLRSSLLPRATTNRWLKPLSQTSNAADDIGAPWSIYRGTLDGSPIGALIPISTQFGTYQRYSSYFGLAPDWGVGFAILSVDMESAADLNAQVDLISTRLLPALEKTAAQRAATNLAGKYVSRSDDPGKNVSLIIKIDGLSGLSVTSWRAGNGGDIRTAYSQVYNVPVNSTDFRLYPTNVEDKPSNSLASRRQSFRAVLQDIDAPVDVGTPTCITWMAGIDSAVVHGLPLDEFVFDFGKDGVARSVSVAALNLTMRR